MLPLFGYTVFVVLRVSELGLPGPGLLGLSRQHLILMEPRSQVGLGTPGPPRPSPLPTSPRGAERCCPCAPRSCAAPSP